MPRIEHAYPLYRTYSVGFHHFNPGQRYWTSAHGDMHKRVFRPLLPQYAVLRPHVGMVQLEYSECQEIQGIVMCAAQAIEANPRKHPFLDMLLGGCTECLSDCVLQAEESEESMDEYQVLNTPAGTLVRAANRTVIAYPAGPNRHPEREGTVLKPSKGEAYFVDFARFKYFSVGNKLFATQGSELHSTLITKTPFAMPYVPDYKVRLPSSPALAELDVGRQLTHLRAELLRSHPILDISPMKATSFFASSYGLLFIGLMLAYAFLLYKAGYCCCAGSRARKRWAGISELEAGRKMDVVEERINRRIDILDRHVEQRDGRWEKELPFLSRQFHQREYMEWTTATILKLMREDEQRGAIPVGSVSSYQSLSGPASGYMAALAPPLALRGR